MGIPQAEDSQAQVGYRTRYQELPAFDLIGFTKIVKSGGELYGEVRSDGRWEVLRSIAGDDKTIYGVASLDKDCPKGSYRYTLGVKAPADARLPKDLFSMHIKPSGWIVFELESFVAQYGKFWGDDPYKMIKKLGWDFNSRLGLHIDAYAPSYSSDSDPMEFMMPVRRAS